MATVDEVFKLVKYRANKSGFNGNISPDDFNLLFPRAEIRYFNQEYAQYYKTQRISDTLSKFMSDPTPITIASNGRSTTPTDLFHVDSITVIYNSVQYPVMRVEKDRIANRLSSVIEPPTTQFPIYTEYNGFMQFYPVNLATASLVYLKAPTTVIWNYTITNGRPIYNPTGSVNPDWSDTDIDAIIYFMLQDLGINMRDGDLSNFAMNQRQTTV